MKKILDSGDRTEFESGAVRDMREGKGRCDLLPLDVVCEQYSCPEVRSFINTMFKFQNTGDALYLKFALATFMYSREWDINTMMLEVAKHFEEGAKKYGDNNWRKGIPVRFYIDSALRHYFKFLREDQDEPHDRAVCWNIMCAMWTCNNMPELNEYRKSDSDGT